MTPRGLNDSGVSGAIGAIFLIIIVVAGMSLLMVAVISQPHQEKVPAMTADVINTTSALYLKHDGGDTLTRGEFQILVDGQDKTTAFGDPATWSVGQTLIYSVNSGYDPQNIPGTIQIVYTGGGYGQTIEQLWVRPPTLTASPTATTTSPVPGTSHNITASAGVGGVISPGGVVTVSYGASQMFSITANSGYHVADVLIDGASNGTVPGYTFSNVVADHTIATTFTINTYQITASTGANGNVTPAGVTTVNYGATPLYKILPATGYHVADVVVNGASVGAVTNYTFPAVTANQTINATFAIDTPVYRPGFVANYYRDETWSTLAGTRTDNEIRYANAEANTTSWLHAPTDESNWPIPMVGKDTEFSVAWDGYLLVPQGDTYTFSLTSDDGSWLWIDEGLVIDNGGYHGVATKTGTIPLSSGYHHIVVMMFQHYSLAVAQLQYSSPTMPLQQVTNVWHTSISPQPPVASFTGTPLAGPLPLTVIFTDSSTNTPKMWAWTFGDGTTSTIQNPSHQYTSTGTYTVVLTAKNAAGSNTLTKTKYITVRSATHIITASISKGGQLGSISPSGSQTVTDEGTQAFTMTPNNNKYISGVVVDGTPLPGFPWTNSSAYTYTFTNVVADHTISTSFTN